MEDVDGAERANKLFDQQREDLVRLRVEEAGRSRIEALLHDADPGVRLMAASEALLWAPKPAREVLRRLDENQDTPWQHSISAKTTLKEFDAGRLKFDW